MKGALELTPHLNTTMQRLFEDYNKNRGTAWKKKQRPDKFQMYLQY